MGRTLWRAVDLLMAIVAVALMAPIAIAIVRVFSEALSRCR